MTILLFLLEIAGVLLAILYFRFRWQHRRILAVANTLPCPPTLYIMGNALFFTGEISDLTRKLISYITQFKSVFCIWAGIEPIFVVSNPSDVQIVLTNSGTLQKDYIYDFLKQFGGDGLITMDVCMWRKYRPLVNPVLHPSNVKLFLPVFNDISRDLVKKFLARKDFFDPSDDILNASFDAVFGTVSPIAGLDTGTKENIKRLMHLGGALFSKRIFRPWLHIDSIFELVYRKDVEKAMEAKYNCLNMLNQVLKKLESCGKELIEKNISNNGVNPAVYECPGKNIFDIYIENPADGSDLHDWKHEITTMVAASTDTTAASLPFFITTLANHPDVQAKVREEIHSVVGDTDRDVTMDDLNAMTYLGQAITESMRLHGSIPLLLRKATRDTQLTKCTLPAGSRIMVPLHAMGWNPALFPDPQKYLPERFSPENQKERSSYAFVPFSSGPRGCPGKTFSMALMKTVMVHILRNCKVRSSVRLEDIEYQLKTVVFSKHPMLVKLDIDK